MGNGFNEISPNYIVSFDESVGPLHWEEGWLDLGLA